jgi:hypothetical protein
MASVRKKVIGCVLAVCLMPVLVAAFFLLAGMNRSREYHGSVPAFDAIDASPHQLLLKKVLPPGARDIVYMVAPRAVAVYVDFTVQEAEFIEWCRQRGWKIEQIEREIPFPPVSGKEPHRLAIGLHHEHKIPRNGDRERVAESLEIYYDTRSSRCYLRQIRSFP